MSQPRKSPLQFLVNDLIAALERGEHEINTAPSTKRGMQDLQRTVPVAVDARLAPNLQEIEHAVSTHRSIWTGDRPPHLGPLPPGRSR